MKQFTNFIYSKKVVLLLMMAINITFCVLSFMFLKDWVYWTFSFVTVVFMIGFICVNNESPEKKIIWVLLVFLLPIFAVALYIYERNFPGTNTERKRLLKISYKSSQLLMEDREVKNLFENNEPKFKKVGRYLYSSALMPINVNTEAKHFANGESYINELIHVLDGAKKFIFLEFNRIEDGKIWTEVFEILREKARSGLEITLLYDDSCCQNGFKDKNTFKKLPNHKIKAVPFNKVKKLLPKAAYVDNRSMVIVDGVIGFLGSVNIADDYVNMKEEAAVKKDSGVKLTGDAVWNMTVMFLNHYQLASKINVDVSEYKQGYKGDIKPSGFIQPFGSSPLVGSNRISRDVYSQFVNLAERTIYITTPYLLLDEEMKKVLKMSTQSGVDIRIITSSISAKKGQKTLSQTYYTELIKAGVKVYEYAPGVINSRMIIADEVCAVVGTIPFDFRSTYADAEAGVVIYSKRGVVQVVDDFNEILSHSKLITLRDLKKRKVWQKIWGLIFRFFSPLFSN